MEIDEPENEKEKNRNKSVNQKKLLPEKINKVENWSFFTGVLQEN